MTFGANWLETLFCERCGRYREPREALTQSTCANCGAQPDATRTTVSYEVPVRPTALLLELQGASAKRAGRSAESAQCSHNEAIEMTSESARQVVRGGESCPNCNGQELFYETVQMRSADEGQTILYQCCRCRTRFTQHS
ncbi:hypothetical protein CCYA_CCYA14G3662 [Cyanidiococcus yangmingshanensis]|uniref:DNA-directed RNA polymerase I subunit RPA12 n=1 Tax=Cyanidiococcus yangmingshanensis TaxID=2690220 RepID=A0A7J7IFE8_9RHOD|nr:DNA-directed RNA polymerase I subunit RPA12 [Cyanidiococcus yangmingshanensis]KAK4532805.1 hypothetical protein CCYA_CCYA14G3662 [Cyanidiococcus yangmingshanensis]